MISARNLTLTYDRRAVIHHLHFELMDQKTLAIIGANGSGKTTLLKALAGIIPAEKGQLQISFAKTERGYLPQQHSVDPSLPVTLEEFVSMGLLKGTGVFRSPTAQEKNRAEKVLERLQLLSLRRLPLKALSGGQMQRALWARLLLLNPQLILLDEPFNHLDEAGLKLVLQVLLDWKQENRTIAIVLHDLTLADRLADQVLSLTPQAPILSPNPTLCLNDLTGA